MYRQFQESREYVHTLELKSQKEWKKYAKSKDKPKDIPARPDIVYKKEWISWGDWLGTGRIATFIRKFRSFNDAREYVHTLGLKDKNQWEKYVESKDKPKDIPADPSSVYKKEWISWGDWLGTGFIHPSRRKYLSFEEARKIVHQLELKNREKWKEYCKSGKKPEDIPSNPVGSYKMKWSGWGDWLGTGFIHPSRRKYVSFEEAKEFVHTLGLKSQKAWRSYLKSGKKPTDIPNYPEHAYKKFWIGWGDWLGTGNVHPSRRRYMQFEDSRKFVHSLELKSQKEWDKYCKSGKKPTDIPSYPEHTYKKYWIGWGDWLGTGTIAVTKREFRIFEEAKNIVHQLGLKSREEWHKYCKSGKRPSDIAANPRQHYQKDWKGWGDWLGTGFIASQNRKYMPFEEARKIVHQLELKNREKWKEYCKSGNKTENIPRYPNAVYKKYWKGWGDWLGTGFIAATKREFLPFEEAKKYARTLGLNSREEWDEYRESKKRPNEIPANPGVTYGDEWKGWPDWLGYEEESWSVRKVKGLIQGLIESGIIYNWKEAVLYSLLLRKGVLNLTNNQHKQFFKNLVDATRYPEGRKLIEDYVYSSSEEPPDLSKFSSSNTQTEGNANTLDTLSSEDLSKIANGDPLDYNDYQDVQQILKNTNVLESINVDEEAIKFYINYSVNEIWKAAFRNESKSINEIIKEEKNGNKYHDSVIEKFLTDYYGVKKLQKTFPDNFTTYSFPFPPTLMQLFVAYKMSTNSFFGNFSGTGAGKTLSAVLSSRITNSKLTVIICPNDVVEQWKRNIKEIFSNSYPISGKNAFYTLRDDNEFQYIILNYDKFSLNETPNLILNLIKQKIDFVVLDEIHFVKKRDENSSIRRKNLEGLLTAIRKKNPKIRILGLSATPVVNNLNEGKSLLELMTGKVYDDISTSPTIPNAVTLYEKLSTLSIRELPQYNIDINTEHIEISTVKPTGISIKQLKSNPLSIEQYLTDARIKCIIKLISGQTIIYTEYVTNIIDKISYAVKNAGFSYDLYTGSNHSGLTRFLQKKVQVLIASRPISTGVDGLQKICNRLIINTLPWTNAQYQQLLGRLVRKGQIKDIVNVYVIKTDIAGYPYDQIKWNRIQFKRTLADCAIDGRLPETNLVTPQQAAMEAVKWLERIERGEVSTVIRQDLNVELTPVQIEQRIIKYGDFTRLNNKVNSENSETTNKRLIANPEEWREYHRQYREARKIWIIIPYEEIITRIGQLSPRLQIGDFGCGEAKIMEKFGTNRVYSFDHIAISNTVMACDMKKVPIPDDSIDIAVFSLSLMGKNWIDYLQEAKRCLATNGYLLIAETTKSLRSNGGRLSKLRETLKVEGFEIYEDVEKGDFTFIEARNI